MIFFFGLPFDLPIDIYTSQNSHNAPSENGAVYYFVSV